MTRTEPRASYDQDVWWKDRDGIFHLIDDMSEDWRRFCARMMIDRAATSYFHHRKWRIISDYWSFVEYANDKDWGPVNEEEPTTAEIFNRIRKEQAQGLHLSYVRTSPLFQRMIRDLEWLHPGVL